MSLYISDMDGTLLDIHSQFSDYTASVLTDLIDNHGLDFSVASGRTPLSALHLIKQFNIKSPIVLMNGGMIYDTIKKEIIDCVPMDEADVDAIIHAEEAGISGMSMYMENGKFCVNVVDENDIAILHYANFDGIKGIDCFKQTAGIGTTKDCPRDSLLFTLYASTDKSIIWRMVDILKAESKNIYIDSYHDMYHPDTYCLELTNLHTNKGLAIAKIKKYLGIDEVIGFGDGANDVSAAKECSEFYAVANGKPVIKEVATDVIGDCFEDGVAKFLKQRFAVK